MDASHSQTRIVVVEVLRRAVALALFVAAATLGFGYGQVLWALLAVVIAILAYVLPPRPKPPQGAITHDRMPTVYMPDLLGFMLATLFLALPLIISAQEPWLGGPWGIYLLTGLPALVVMFIFWISTRHQCMWLKVTGHDLTIADMHDIVTLPFGEIAEVTGVTRQPPRWLSPLLVLFGGWRGLGIALLTGERASHALAFKLTNGTERRVPSDALSDERKLLAALAHGGVRLGNDLRAYAGKPSRRRAGTSRRKPGSRSARRQ